MSAKQTIGRLIKEIGKAFFPNTLGWPVRFTCSVGFIKLGIKIVAFWTDHLSDSKLKYVPGEIEYKQLRAINV